MDMSRQRLILACKVGLAVLLSSVFTLNDAAYDFTSNGSWATVTVVIVMQSTLGSTTNKAIQRCLGTIFAAASSAKFPDPAGGGMLLPQGKRVGVSPFS